MFHKGHHIGRPKGSKDQSWAKITYWFELLKTELNKKIDVTERTRDGSLIRTYQTDAVDPNKRAEIYLQAMKMLCSKAKQLPIDPTESKLNADRARIELQALEDGGHNPPIAIPPKEGQERV